jgi:hypothetical protein
MPAPATRARCSRSWSTPADVERNALINPAHADYRAIRVVEIAPVRWDDRLSPRTA